MFYSLCILIMKFKIQNVPFVLTRGDKDAQPGYAIRFAQGTIHSTQIIWCVAYCIPWHVVSVAAVVPTFQSVLLDISYEEYLRELKEF